MDIRHMAWQRAVEGECPWARMGGGWCALGGGNWTTGQLDNYYKAGSPHNAKNEAAPATR